MDPLNRLKSLSSQMHLEPAEDALCPQHDRMDEVYLSKAVLPNGQRIDLLKTLLTSVCERDCYYCPFRAGRDSHRVSFTPQARMRWVPPSGWAAWSYRAPSKGPVTANSAVFS